MRREAREAIEDWFKRALIEAPMKEPLHDIKIDPDTKTND